MHIDHQYVLTWGFPICIWVLDWEECGILSTGFDHFYTVRVLRWQVGRPNGSTFHYLSDWLHNCRAHSRYATYQRWIFRQNDFRDNLRDVWILHRLKVQRPYQSFSYSSSRWYPISFRIFNRHQNLAYDKVEQRSFLNKPLLDSSHGIRWLLLPNEQNHPHEQKAFWSIRF